jgi:hypothetical protein
VNELLFYVSSPFFPINLIGSFPESLLRKEQDVPVRAHAIPTRAQRPTPPRHIAPPPPVRILLFFP